MRPSVVLRSVLAVIVVAGGLLLASPSGNARPAPARPAALHPVQVGAKASPVRGAATVHTAAPFAMVGVRWTGARPDLIEVRTLSVDGKRSRWTRLEPSDAQPERGRASTTTEPVWTGPSRDLQVRVFRQGRPVVE